MHELPRHAGEGALGTDQSLQILRILLPTVRADIRVLRILAQLYQVIVSFRGQKPARTSTCI